MKYSHPLNLLFAISLLSCLVSLAYARHCFCHHCGCSCASNTVCRLVCEDKKVDVICWGAKCEEFCVPCRGKRGCEHCEVVCTECDCDPDTPTFKPKRFIWAEWLPTKATMYTRTKLMKKTITKTVPTYKWVVEDLCPHCQARCEYASVGPDVQLPPVPVENSVVLYGKLPPEQGSANK